MDEFTEKSIKFIEIYKELRNMGLIGVGWDHIQLDHISFVKYFKEYDKKFHSELYPICLYKMINEMEFLCLMTEEEYNERADNT